MLHELSIVLKLNSWDYSSEELGPTEVDVTRWQCRGPSVSKALSLNLTFHKGHWDRVMLNFEIVILIVTIL